MPRCSACINAVYHEAGYDERQDLTGAVRHALVRKCKRYNSPRQLLHHLLEAHGATISKGARDKIELSLDWIHERVVSSRRGRPLTRDGKPANVARTR